MAEQYYRGLSSFTFRLVRLTVAKIWVERFSFSRFRRRFGLVCLFLAAVFMLTMVLIVFLASARTLLSAPIVWGIKFVNQFGATYFPKFALNVLPFFLLIPKEK